MEDEVRSYVAELSTKEPTGSKYWEEAKVEQIEDGATYGVVEDAKKTVVSLEVSSKKTPILEEGEESVRKTVMEEDWRNQDDQDYSWELLANNTLSILDQKDSCLQLHP